MNFKQAVAAISNGQWQGVKAFVAGASPEAAYELIRTAYDACPTAIDVDAAIGGPDDLVGLTVAGAFHFGIGKRHRGMRAAAEVREKQAVLYIERLYRARTALDDALALDRRYGLAAAFAMAVASDELEDGQKDQAEAVLLDARDVPLSGYVNLLQARLEKWGGSHADMFRIARSRMLADAPMQHILIARAHWERYLYYAAFDDSEQASEMAEVYFTGDVMDDLKAASDAVLNGRDADPAEQRLANGWLAFVLSQAGQYKRAVRHLDRIRGHNDPAVWFFYTLPPVLAKASIRLKAMFS
jgi:hypothetical protein